jgi:NADH-quinone oxidoreductase subunit C
MEDVVADPHALDDAHLALVASLVAELGDAVLDHAGVFGMPVLRVQRVAWRQVAEIARAKLECDFLSFISGIDWMPAPREGDDDSGDTSAPVQPTETTYGATGSEGRFQVFARVQSTGRHWGFTAKVDVDESAMLVQSWVPVYPGADWHERECWEMYGFVFDGHPALRHLYLPSEFEGHPLRKDYPLLARVVKPWPGLVDVEPMPGDDDDAEADAATTAEEGT